MSIRSYFIVGGGGGGGGGFLYKKDEYILAIWGAILGSIPGKSYTQGSIVSTPDPSLEHLHPFEGLGGFRV